MKHSILAAFALLGLVSCAHADLIKQGSTYTRTVLMTTASDHISPYTGAASALSVQYAQAGAAMTTPTTAPTITAQGNGRYAITLTSAYTGTLGALDLTVTASGADPSDTHDQVVAFDPGDAAALGLTKIALVGTNAGDSPNGVLAQGQAAANGMALGTLTSRPAQTGDAYGLLSPLIASGKYTAAALSLAPTGSGGGSVTDASITADMTSVLASGVTLKSTEYANIAQGVNTSIVANGLTNRQAAAVGYVYNFGPYTRVKTATTQTLTWPAAGSLPGIVSVSNLDSIGNVTGRASVTFSNLP